MNPRQNPFFWSFPVGTYYATRVRVSVYFPLLVIIVCLTLDSVQLGLTVSGILFASILLHEFAHIAAVRYTGGHGEEILMWPLGGLAYVEPARNFTSQFFTAFAGPLTHIVICGLTLPAVVYSEHASTAWNPLFVPSVDLSHRVLSDLLVLTFSLNWSLLLLNLIPLFPLDGSRMLQSWLQVHSSHSVASDITFKVGFVFGLALVIVGVVVKDAYWLMGLGLFLMFLAFIENQRVQMGESYDDSFMGYDFSQGYTSLERSQPVVQEARPSKFQRWMARRKAEKQRRRQEQEQEAELQLDSILAKLHDAGMSSLTEAEKRLLNRASARYRDKGKPQV